MMMQQKQQQTHQQQTAPENANSPAAQQHQRVTARHLTGSEFDGPSQQTDYPSNNHIFQQAQLANGAPRSISPSSTFPPPSFYIGDSSYSSHRASDPSRSVGSQQPPTVTSSISPYPVQPEEIYQFILDLTIGSRRERALLELSRRRESLPDLAPILWHSFGVIASLLQEIVSIYPQLTPPTLGSVSSNRVCNALALLQCLASHPDTRHHFLNAHIPLFLYPFLNTVSVSRPFEYLRLTSLGVIGALVKIDDHQVIGFLLQTEIISLCLRIMEMGSELSKTVATFIVQKILLDDLGLRYVTATAERFYAVSSVLSGMVLQSYEQPSPRLIKHIVKCYLRLADNPRAREALKRCIPAAFRQGAFLNAIKEDITTQRNIETLMDMIDNAPPNGGPYEGHHQLFDITSVSDLLAKAQKQQQLQ